MGRAAGLLLAAGAGRRLGGHPKALLHHRGGLLVEHAAHTLRAGGCDPVLVVLGAAADEVRARARLPGCETVVNPNWARGMGSSLRAGLAALSAHGTAGRRPRGRAHADEPPTAVVVHLVDLPGVGPEVVARLLAAHSVPDDLIAAGYGGRRGHPVLFGAAWWEELRTRVEGDTGARAVLADSPGRLRLIECGDIADPGDVDTPGDLARLRRGY